MKDLVDIQVCLVPYDFKNIDIFLVSCWLVTCQNCYVQIKLIYEFGF